MDLPINSKAEPIHNLAEAVDQSDYWTGISDPVARRKRQNRLNQRARRRRQAPDKWTPLQSKIHDIQSGHQVLPYQQTTKGRPGTLLRLPAVLLDRISSAAARERAATFPLSTDHLIHLIQFNVYRAIMSNVVTLQLWHVMACEFADKQPDLQKPQQRNQEQQEKQQHLSIFPLPLATAIPPTLEPTRLQLQTPHPPWIDVFPHPGLRDAMIRATGLYDEHELCVDMVGSIANDHLDCKPELSKVQHDWIRSQNPSGDSGGGGGVVVEEAERFGFVCWGDPWRVESWEIEEGFVRKWGWLLRENCEDLLSVTDRWRRVRGEEPFPWKRWGIKSSSSTTF